MTAADPPQPSNAAVEAATARSREALADSRFAYPAVVHRFLGVARGDDGLWHGSCACQTTIVDADKDAVWARLAEHMVDEVPELRAARDEAWARTQLYHLVALQLQALQFRKLLQELGRRLDALVLDPDRQP